MLQLEFNVFQEKVKADKLVDHYATIHCMIEDDRFTFVMKSKEKWNYYTVVKYDEIFEFAINTGMTADEAINMFVTNYCSNTLPILPTEKKEIEDVINYEEAPREELEDINKSDSRLGNQNSSSTISKDTTPVDVIEPGDDLVSEAKDYSDFLLKFFDKLEKKVLSSVKNIEDELGKQDKTFGSFLRDMFNVVNTSAFIKEVRHYLKIDLINGLKSAETELDVDIGYTEAFQDKLNQLSFQQMDGYLINGRKWPGIKGVTKEIQAKIVQTVQEGINGNLTLKDIKENIQKDFDGFSNWRSSTIARTETTRITNEGKILGYKETGIKGEKVWSSAHPRGCPNCSEICDRLDGQAVPLDDDFVDPVTHKRYFAPPGHPNCKSTVFFRPI